MSALTHSLNSLWNFLEGQGLVLPTRHAVLVEVPSGARVDERGRLRVSRSSFVDPGAYEARFDELLSSGLPWINVGCCGLDGSRLVVVIEMPQPRGSSSLRTSVNYSGPTSATVKRGWDVDEMLAIT